MSSAPPHAQQQGRRSNSIVDAWGDLTGGGGGDGGKSATATATKADGQQPPPKPSATPPHTSQLRTKGDMAPTAAARTKGKDSSTADTKTDKKSTKAKDQVAKQQSKHKPATGSFSISALMNAGQKGDNSRNAASSSSLQSKGNDYNPFKKPPPPPSLFEGMSSSRKVENGGGTVGGLGRTQMFGKVKRKKKRVSLMKKRIYRDRTLKWKWFHPDTREDEVQEVEAVTFCFPPPSAASSLLLLLPTTTTTAAAAAAANPEETSPETTLSGSGAAAAAAAPASVEKKTTEGLSRGSSRSVEGSITHVDVDGNHALVVAGDDPTLDPTLSLIL